ncbi:MAG: PAS domain-containing protein [Candidatus Izemoplasmatales bacterium]|jgi:DUF438 domain-containing protein|nr:PAS domain-containing protein [Candidatus Izemoplasmatales bacterium]
MEIFKYDQSRIDRINLFMKKLQENSSTEEKVRLYKEYEEDILKLRPLDIFYLDFYSDKSPLSIAEIKESANRFVNVFHKGIAQKQDLGEDSFFREILSESKRMETHLAKIKPYYKREVISKNKEELWRIFNECKTFDLKFNKMQNVIFSHLEGVLPSNKPLEVLWELHDDARALLNTILVKLKNDDTDEEELIKLIGTYHYLIFGINQKEELILLPVMKQLLKREEIDSIYQECVEIGFVFKEPEKPKKTKESEEEISGYFISKTGKISIKELIQMLNHLPMDITFVDKHDTVLYYNESKKRHFPRTPSVIGRQVKNCHPPKSVHVVEGIIADFKDNKKDFEEFWINFKGETLYIAYYAVRDELGEYLGVLEVSQDITKFKNLTGEKRLRED